MDEAWHLSACVAGAYDNSPNLAHEAVFSLEFQMLQRGWPVGTALGALPYVQKSLGVGRPACREAITILEARGLLDVRRGPGGGLFVSAPPLEEVTGMMLMYLALSGAGSSVIREFRMLVWQMVVNSALDRDVRGFLPDAGSGEGFAMKLAQKLNHQGLVMAASLAEMLVRMCGGPAMPEMDLELSRAMLAGDRVGSMARIAQMVQQGEIADPMNALELIERGHSWSGRKPAIGLAARMIREMSQGKDRHEAEWQTADRLGYSDAVVRQARRVLQDLGILRCQQGRKGAVWTAPTSPAGVIRLLAPCIMARGVSVEHNIEVASYLADCAPVLAARRVREKSPGLCFAPKDIEGQNEALRIENLMLDLCGNPLLAMLVRGLGMANIFVDGLPKWNSFQVNVGEFNRRILKAIMAGDEEGAAGLAAQKSASLRRCADLVRSEPELAPVP